MLPSKSSKPWKLEAVFKNFLLKNPCICLGKPFEDTKIRAHFQYQYIFSIFDFLILKEDASPHSFALKIKFTSWKWTTLALCFDSQFHFHLSFDLIIDFRVGYIPSLLYLPLVLVYTVKKASPWVVVRHANSMVPHDKFSIPDGPMCCHSKAAFQLQKRNIVTTKVRVRFCVENDFWWDAFLHTTQEFDVMGKQQQPFCSFL